MIHIHLRPITHLGTSFYKSNPPVHMMALTGLWATFTLSLAGLHTCGSHCLHMPCSSPNQKTSKASQPCCSAPDASQSISSGASTLAVALQFDMASADGTHLFGHQRHLPNQPQLYEIQLDLDNDEHEVKPAISIMAGGRCAAAAAAETNSAAAVYAREALIAGHPGQPQQTCARSARFSLLAPEYSSDMPIISKAYYGRPLLLVSLHFCQSLQDLAAQCLVVQQRLHLLLPVEAHIHC